MSAPSQPSVMSDPPVEPGAEGHFRSLDACLTSLREAFPGHDGSANPRYLFRGEKHWYRETSPGVLRLLAGGAPVEVKFALMDVAEMFLEEHESDFSEAECLAFLQHYGLPTDCIDVTCSLRVAAAFASESPDTFPVGVIGVLDIEVASASGLCELADLRSYRGAPRARKQHGWAIVHRTAHFPNYKDLECARRVGLRWWTFSKGGTAHLDLPSLDDLYSAAGDSAVPEMVDALSVHIDSPSGAWAESAPAIDALREVRKRLSALL